eukprot:TRINITY_DN18910_c0_g1_i2.p2 TRINITY_DN18910_c0_g1~~TRINITY_DN18910_c0_g1_i2.p2  ORF type:complete len:230 (-),score=9.40 TRINITY_DN18910_c0_g1_i2:355-1014(-)
MAISSLNYSIKASRFPLISRSRNFSISSFAPSSPLRLKTRISNVQSVRSRKLQIQTQNQYGSTPRVPERVIAALPYLLPLLDGIRYGRFLFMQYPVFAKLLAPLTPLIEFYYGFPLGSLIIFFGLYLGIVNNMNFDRFVRLNAMQAILLDIILIIPQLFESVLKIRPTDNLGLSAYMLAYNTIWLFVFVCVSYGIGACLVGFTARIPLVRDAAEQQTRL